MSSERIKKAVEDFYAKALKEKKQPRKQKNQKPEQIVVKQIYLEMKKMNFLPLIVEAKAVYNQDAGRYLGSQVAPGTSDILAASPQGYFVACEVKAKGLRRTLKPHQKEFLLSVIDKGSFGCCSDSVEHFVALYHIWISSGRPKELLIKDLPVLEYEKDIGPLFPD
jgi:hypothetical protein